MSDFYSHPYDRRPYPWNHRHRPKDVAPGPLFPHTAAMTKLTSLFIAYALSAAAQPNLAGIWQATTPEPIMAKIDQQGGAFEFTIRAAGTEQSYKAVVGQETTGAIGGVPITIGAEWDSGTLVVHIHAAVQGKEVRVTSRYTLSSDGNALDLQESHKLTDTPEGKDARVYTRRPATAWVKDPPPTPAEAVYKNIQIMKGVPAPRLQDVMTKLTRWLGVECAYCHVAGHFESDDQPAKQTARKMFTMVRAINHDNFPGTDPVTCWTCHRGAAKPQSLPQ